MNVPQCKKISNENYRHNQYFSLFLAASDWKVRSIGFCDCQFNIYKNEWMNVEEAFTCMLLDHLGKDYISNN